MEKIMPRVKKYIAKTGNNGTKPDAVAGYALRRRGRGQAVICGRLVLCYLRVDNADNYAGKG